MSIVFRPYTYILKCPGGKFYYGVRYAQECHPSEFFNTYFTSSNHIKSLIEKYGKDHPDWKWEIRKIFDNSEKARIWEHRVLRRLKVISRDDFWNKTDNISFQLMFGNDNPQSRPEAKAKLSAQVLGEKNPMFGKFFYNNSVKNIVLSPNERIPTNYSKGMLRADNSGRKNAMWGENIKDFMSAKKYDMMNKNRAKSNTGIPRPQKTVVCPHCGKSGGNVVMHRHHFDKCEKL